jgi:hypothetical protein
MTAETLGGASYSATASGRKASGNPACGREAVQVRGRGSSPEMAALLAGDHYRGAVAQRAEGVQGVQGMQGVGLPEEVVHRRRGEAAPLLARREGQPEGEPGVHGVAEVHMGRQAVEERPIGVKHDDGHPWEQTTQ